ncbi:hypothetical protein Tco_0710154 [Tanacetum coccineum]
MRCVGVKCSHTKEGALAAQHGSSGWFQSAQKSAFVAWQQPASTRPLGPRHSSPCSSNSGSMPTVARLRKQRQQWQQPTVHASMHGDVARMSNRRRGVDCKPRGSAFCSRWCKSTGDARPRTGSTPPTYAHYLGGRVMVWSWSQHKYSTRKS